IDLGPVDITTGTGISIACWVKPSSTSMQDQLVVAKAYDPLFGDFVWSLGTALHTAVRFRLQTVGNTTAITSPPNSIFPGAFYHLAATYDGTGMQIFINGALVANANKSGFIGYHPQALAAMGHLDIGPGVVPFEGIIGDVRIWDRALTPSEIIDLVLEQDISMSTVPSASANDPSTGPFTLFDANGRMILRSNSIPTALQTDVLPPGLYVLTSYDGAGVRSAKWMKP
ncbi:MAG: LamG-like jellyroll fold domain-containing protein, partial [Flavobacteriales bacterium]